MSNRSTSVISSHDPSLAHNVIGSEHSFTSVNGVLSYFSIALYAHSPRPHPDGVKAKPDAPTPLQYIGIDRYKDFFVVYDLDFNYSATTEFSIYIVYPKNKSFHPKQILHELNKDKVTYLIRELYCEDHLEHRITQITCYSAYSLEFLKLIQYLKAKLQYYPILNQFELNRKLEKFVDINKKLSMISEGTTPAKADKHNAQPNTVISRKIIKHINKMEFEAIGYHYDPIEPVKIISSKNELEIAINQTINPSIFMGLATPHFLLTNTTHPDLANYDINELSDRDGYKIIHIWTSNLSINFANGFNFLNLMS